MEQKEKHLKIVNDDARFLGACFDGREDRDVGDRGVELDQLFGLERVEFAGALASARIDDMDLFIAWTCHPCSGNDVQDRCRLAYPSAGKN